MVSWKELWIEEGSAWIQSLEQHILLSLGALLIAFCIAFPLAIIVRKHPKVANIFLQLANIVQTIPSLAILGLLIPLVGIGSVPALVTLVLYAILPIFQNTYTGLTTINPNYQFTIKALGLPSRFALWKIELPMAWPMVLSGVKISLVMIIGTATLAALVGAGGLGTFIVQGIDSNNNQLLLIGAISAAVLALLFSFFFSLLEKGKKRRWIGILGILVLFLGSFLGTLWQNRPETKEEKPIVIAGKLGSEPSILIEMYKQLIEQEDPKAEVILKPNFGKTMFLFNALEKEQIDIYPEFSGTLLKSILKSKEIPKTEKETYELAKKGVQQKYQMDYLSPMKYQNTYGIVVEKDFAKQHHLENIGDLVSVENQCIAGFDSDFDHQPDGYPSVQKVYRLNFSQIKVMDPSLKYKALINHNVNVIDVFTTDAWIEQYHLTVLKDNQHAFSFYQGAPLMRDEFAKEHPKVVKALNRLGGKITEKEMQKMNYQVIVQKKDPAVVAKNYLQSRHLIEKRS